MAEPLLRVEDLRTYFHSSRGTVRAVDGVGFTLDKGRTLAIVGESGCGKSMTALSILQLVPEPAGYIESGRILYGGQDLLDYTVEEMRAIRGKEISMIFQEPMTSLNPVFTVGMQIIEAMAVHDYARGKAVRTRALELLDLVNLPNPAQVLRSYPFELSGGMRQRVMIAIALACDPDLLIADEPTTALDVTVQAQILELIAGLQRRLDMAVLLITHDLGVVAEMADDVAVMYAGQIVESAPTRELFRDPKHPYTQGLFASLPHRRRRGQELAVLEGTVPDPAAWPPGCRFEPRCPKRFEPCRAIPPVWAEPRAGHIVACHLYPPGVTEPSPPPARSAAAAPLPAEPVPAGQAPSGGTEARP
jgi:oligopeptide/dipeptide ABC transporter ATP-binding protein